MGFAMDIGNPVFAKGSFTIIAYDLYIKDKGMYNSFITDTQTGKGYLLKEGVVKEELGLIGSCPSFSPDNKHIVYQYFDEGEFTLTLRILDLKDGLDGIREGSDRALMSEGKELEGLLPTWFQLNSSSDVEDGAAHQNEGEPGSNQYNSENALFKEDKGGCFIKTLF